MAKMLKNTESGKQFNLLTVYLIAFIALLIRLLLMSFADETDSDAVSRVFTSWNWAADPYWFKTSVWAPFHYYLVGTGFLIWKDMLLLPKVLHILFSVFMLFPFYYFTKREFNKPGAMYATIFLAFSPLIFRLGFQCLAEIPGVFFTVLAMNLLSKGVREENNVWLALSGISMTLASGLRYEAWLIILLFALVLIIARKWKGSLMFFLFAMIFPAVWMAQNYLATGDPLFSFSANTDWTHKALGINDHVDFEAYLRRIWFFPFSLLIAIGPIVSWLIVKYLAGYAMNFRFRSFPDLWLIPSLAFFVVMLYNAIAGNLLLHHRFTSTLVILVLPWIAAVLKDFEKKAIRIAAISVVLTIGLSFAYTIGGSSPIPRLKNQSVKQLVSEIKPVATPGSKLVIDFIGWEDTWFTGLHSGAEPPDILMLGGESYPPFSAERVAQFLLPAVDKIIVVKDGSSLQQYLSENLILSSSYNELYRQGEISVYISSKDQD
jgi:4-amino-4-deoxy-L-arabinose transferase-like glycosyltransferase